MAAPTARFQPICRYCSVRVQPPPELANKGPAQLFNLPFCCPECLAEHEQKAERQLHELAERARGTSLSDTTETQEFMPPSPRPFRSYMWGKGPWCDEPNVRAFMAHGYRVQALRHHLGALCGYILIPQGHPWHGKLYTSDVLSDVRVHGGFTYSQPGSDKESWVLGFDCSHAFDLIPLTHQMVKAAKLPPLGGELRDTYKTMNEVCTWLMDLALQAKKAAQLA